jgi:type VI secretion system secreted protein Hcp
MIMNHYASARYCLSALALAAALSCHAASDFFLKIDGIDGESIDPVHRGEIEIQSFSWGMSNSGSFATGTGGGAGKASFQDIHFTRALDKASPQLMLACATGKHIPTAELVCRKAGADGKGIEYYRITLTDVLVSSVSTGGNTSGDVPIESISLNFAKVIWEYVPVGADGSPQEPVRAEFDLTQIDPAQ